MLFLRYGCYDGAIGSKELLHLVQDAARVLLLRRGEYQPPPPGGKTLAGFMLAVLSILSFSKLGAALLVLVVPMVDALFILGKRILLGKSPVQATTGHLHHHLLSLGWGRRRIAIFYWFISGLAGIIALLTNSKQKVFAVLFILVAVFMFLVWINFLKKLPKKSVSEEF